MYDIDTETAAGNIFNDWCKFNDCLVVIPSSQQFEGEDADQKYCEISIPVQPCGLVIMMAV